MVNKLKANTFDSNEANIKPDTRPKYLASLLVVEDNIVNQIVIKKTLQRLGYEVMVASNGQQGVDMFLEYDFHCVFMDVQMPVMDGIEAAKILRLGHGSEVPIIALTANAQDIVEEACMEAGMNVFLTKPISREQLSATLSEVLNINGKRATG
ncbi:MAG: CheY-like chemotaxis protein [Bermanella sp.]|jgi:CheY-like chemotaxis protein